MHLLAASYHNIGPFAQQRLRVTYHAGTYLINAPIGTGKSFLFFDAPVFALYKYKQRELINNRCDTGLVELIFEVDDVCYLIRRELKRSSVGNTIAKKNILYTIADHHPILTSAPADVVTHETQSLSQQYSHLLEQVETANDSQLQDLLLQLLPLRDVFLHTRCMMQDAKNIFAETPATRIEIFKEIFGLLGIDDAKAVINDYKKELRTKNKLYSDTTSADKQLTQLLSTCQGQVSDLAALTLPSPALEPVITWYDEITLMDKGITIDTFGIDASLLTAIEQAISTIDQYRLDSQKIALQRQSLTQSLDTLTKKITTIDTSLGTATAQRTKIATANQAAIDEHNTQRARQAQISADREKLLSRIPWETLTTHGYDDEQSHSTLSTRLHTKIADGTHHKTQLDTLTKQRDHQHALIQRYEFRDGTPARDRLLRAQSESIKAIDTDITTHTTQLDDLTARITQLTTRKATLATQLDDLTATISELTGFSCPVDHCPLLDTITSSSTAKLVQQRDQITDEIKRIDTEINTINLPNKQQEITSAIDALRTKRTLLIDDPIGSLPDTVQAIRDEAAQLTADDTAQSISALTAQIETLHHQLDAQRQLFADIAWPTLSSHLEQLTAYDTAYAQLTEQLARGDVSKAQQDLATIDAQITQLHEQRTTLVSEQGAIQQQLTAIEAQYADMPATLSDTDYTTALTVHKHLAKTLSSLITLAQSQHERRTRLAEVIDEERYVANLYQIFSKELLFFVLQQFLGALEDMINVYLQHVVAFRVSFDTETTSSGKLELEINATDTLGTRPVKSLSGGQMTVLKLARIFAISRLSQSSFLFLDETINNMDAETITLVAEMVEQFATEREMMLYIVTHSPHVHQLPIRDGTIALGELGRGGQTMMSDTESGDAQIAAGSTVFTGADSSDHGGSGADQSALF